MADFDIDATIAALQQLKAQGSGTPSAPAPATAIAPQAPGQATMPHPADPRLANEASSERLAADIASRLTTGIGSALQEQLSRYFPARPVSDPRPNISDRGAARSPDMRDSDGVIHSRPLEATAHDVDQLILKHGKHKGLEMFQARVLDALSRVRIKPPNGR